MSQGRARHAVLAAAACLVLAGQACPGEPPDPADVVPRAPTRTAEARTARVSVEVKAHSRTRRRTRVITAEGVVDLAGSRASLAVNLPDTGTAESVLDGATLYQRLPGIGPATGGKPWIRLEPGSVTRLREIPALARIFDGQVGNPAAALQLLGQGRRATAIGNDEVRGMAVTHYRLEGPTRTAHSAAALLFVPGVGPQLAPAPVDTWIDEEGRVRRVRTALSDDGVPPDQQHGGPGSLRSAELTVEFYEFGVPVSVTPPPPALVFDVAARLADTPPPPTTELSGLVLREVLPGYRLEEEGTLDFVQAASAESDRFNRIEADTRMDLARIWFVTGYHRSWAVPGTGGVVLRAQVWVHLVRDPMAVATYHPPPPHDARPFPVPSVPGAEGYLVLSNPGLVAFAKGPYLVRIVVQGRDGTPETLTWLAGEQYRRL